MLLSRCKAKAPGRAFIQALLALEDPVLKKEIDRHYAADQDDEGAHDAWIELAGVVDAAVAAGERDEFVLE